MKFSVADFIEEINRLAFRNKFREEWANIPNTNQARFVLTYIFSHQNEIAEMIDLDPSILGNLRWSDREEHEADVFARTFLGNGEWADEQMARFEAYREAALDKDVEPLLSPKQRDWATSCLVNWGRHKEMSAPAKKSFRRYFTEVIGLRDRLRAMKQRAAEASAGV